jgi:hypothetical protein
MKRILLLIATFTALMQLFAQHSVGTFTLQPKAGVNIASMQKGDGTRIGFVGGLEGEYQLTDMVSLSVGALYSQQGNKVNIYSYNKDITYKYDYINVPILANVYILKGFAVKLGVQPGFLVHDNLPAEANTKSFDFSIPIGLSYEYKNFVLDGRYNWGTTKVNILNEKNSVFQFTLGYKFEL